MPRIRTFSAEKCKIHNNFYNNKQSLRTSTTECQIMGILLPNSPRKCQNHCGPCQFANLCDLKQRIQLKSTEKNGRRCLTSEFIGERERHTNTHTHRNTQVSTVQRSDTSKSVIPCHWVRSQFWLRPKSKTKVLDQTLV